MYMHTQRNKVEDSGMIQLMYLYLLRPKHIEGFVIPCTLQRWPFRAIVLTKSQRYFLNATIVVKLILSQIQNIFMKFLMPSHAIYMSDKTIVSQYLHGNDLID